MIVSVFMLATNRSYNSQLLKMPIYSEFEEKMRVHAFDRQIIGMVGNYSIFMNDSDTKKIHNSASAIFYVMKLWLDEITLNQNCCKERVTPEHYLQ